MIDDRKTAESLMPGNLVFMVLEHEDNTKVAFEVNYGIVVFGDSINELTENVLTEVEHYFKGAFTGGIRIREFKDTIVKLPFISGKL